MARTCDVLVAGAGIVGSACALELARAGMRVIVADPGPIGGGATGAGMGHIVAMDDSDAQFALSRYSQKLWDQASERLPMATEFSRCGTIWVAASEEEMKSVRKKRRYYGSHGVQAVKLDADSLRRAEPNLRPGLAGGLLVPGDCVVYPPPVAAGFIDEARFLGTEFLNTGIAEWIDGGARLRDGEVVTAGATVNAAGHWATVLDPDLPMRPKKGHLLITDRYPGFVSRQLIELGYLKSAHASDGDSVAFNVQPRATGQMLIGSSRQYDRNDATTDHEILGRMLRRAIEYIPGLSKVSAIRAWTGIRAATADSLPLIGPHPTRANHWLATGHEGLGITTSLGTSKVLAALMAGTELEIPAAPYAPDRPSLEGKYHV